MAKLSASAERALIVVAHVVVATDLSQKAEGLKGFREHYLKTLSAADRAVWVSFEAMVKQAYKDAAAMLEQDIK